MVFALFATRKISRACLLPESDEKYVWERNVEKIGQLNLYSLTEGDTLTPGEVRRDITGKMATLEAARSLSSPVTKVGHLAKQPLLVQVSLGQHIHALKRSWTPSALLRRKVCLVFLLCGILPHSRHFSNRLRLCKSSLSLSTMKKIWAWILPWLKPADYKHRRKYTLHVLASFKLAFAPVWSVYVPFRSMVLRNRYTEYSLNMHWTWHKWFLWSCAD